MPSLKTAALNIRIDPNLKEALRIAAKKDHRPMANMVELLIIKHCESVGISVPEQRSLFEVEPGE